MMQSEGKLEAQIQNTDSRKVYSFDEAFNSAYNYFNGDEVAAKNWVNKYALKDSDGNIYESNPDQMHHRIAEEVARIESKYPNPLDKEKIYNLLKDFRYIVPQGSPMSGIGNDFQYVSLSNCFVIGNEGDSDSYGSIMKTDEEQIQLMKRRGGVGHDLSHLRPKGSGVNNSALTSTGVVPFMERYSNSTREVAQGGRRGALMLTISGKHPDVEDFIDAKMETNKVTGANVSVKIYDDFMRAVIEDKTYTQQYPINSDNPLLKKEINARELWKKIIHNAWKSAEPGILFWDTITRESVADCYADLGFETIATNPCGEIPLPKDDSCRLIVQNIYSYVENPFTNEARFNWDLFKENTHYTQRIKDDIIDLEIEKIDKILTKIDSDPESEEIKYVEKRLWERIKEKALSGRRTGIGITGEGDMLAALGLTYGSEEGNKFSEELHKTLALEVYRSSVNLAKERGAFPIYDSEREKNNPFILRLKEADPKLYEEMVQHGRRNIASLTIAPTGTVSLMTQTTSGLENCFKPIYIRKRKVNPNDKSVRIDSTDESGDHWEHDVVVHHKFVNWLEINGYDVNKVKEYNQAQLDELVSNSPYHNATSEDVDWVNKVKLQGLVQKWVDHSISVTVNLPEDIPEEIVSKVYQTAWEVGCKGITVYREGSRSGVLVSKKESDGGLEERIKLVQNSIKHHPVVDVKSQAIKYRVKRPENGDTLHVILTSDLYVDDESKKAYFIPDEDFQVRAPLGAATSVSFAQSGMDRTEILRGPNPNYAEFVTRLQSAYSNEEEGIGPRRIKSMEHATGLVFEDYLTRNGIIGRDGVTGKLVNLVNKSKLRKVNRNTDEFEKIISQVRITDTGDEIEISGNNGKRDKKFECEICGGTEFTFDSGCSNPKCCACGQYEGGGCG